MLCMHVYRYVNRQDTSMPWHLFYDIYIGAHSFVASKRSFYAIYALMPFAGCYMPVLITSDLICNLREECSGLWLDHKAPVEMYEN